MPSLPVASSFLAGSLLSLILPTALLIGLVIWYVRTIKNVPKGPPAAEIAPITTDGGDSEQTAGHPG